MAQTVDRILVAHLESPMAGGVVAVSCTANTQTAHAHYWMMMMVVIMVMMIMMIIMMLDAHCLLATGDQ